MKNFTLTIKFQIADSDLDNINFKQLQKDCKDGTAEDAFLGAPYQNVKVTLEEDDKSTH
jgi:hypothetical protein